ncbi:MAG: CarD family transcriptional regulator [Bradymonadia bacterium]|jgi:CarD family transcriptional regulator
MVQFSVGDMAVYQGQGIGQITGIGQMQVGPSTVDVYTLRLVENGTTIRIPISKANSVGLRELIDPVEIPGVYEILKEAGRKPEDKTWNRRYRAYMDKLKTGSVHEIARVLRDLYRLKGDKDLSYGERKMLDQARNLLVKELSLASRRDETEVAQELEELFAAEC